MSCGSFVHAQSFLGADGDFSNIPGIGIDANDIDIEMTPEFPSAFDTVTIRLDSNIVDLNRVTISWYVNGSKLLDGVGQRSLQVKIGDYGSVNDVAVRIDLGNKTIQKTIDLSPADITMMYEALDAYVPPFYPGKKIAPSEGVVRITALPNFNTSGGSFDTTKGVYIWKRNKKSLPGAGGYGKNYLTVKNDKLIGSETFSVRASSIDNRVSGEKSFELVPGNPQIHFYQKLWNQPSFAQALDGGFSMSSDAITIQAVPYFFSKNTVLANDLDINWSINDSPLIIEDLKNPFTIIFNNPGSRGRNTLGLQLTHINNIFQEAKNSLSITF
jgi:hypothetical protein